jgi:hypothetical protein
MNSPRALIQLSLEIHGVMHSGDLKAVSHSDAKDYARAHPEVAYEWWTEKTGPGTARVAWRLTLNRNEEKQ